MDIQPAAQASSIAPEGVATRVGHHPHALPADRSMWNCIDGTPCAVCGREYSDRIHRCEHDNCGQLKRPQKRFARSACRSAFHDALHPRVNAPGLDLRAAGSIAKRYLVLMQDGEWRTDTQAALDLHERESVVGRKRRALSARGHVFESRRPAGPQAPAQFRLVLPLVRAAA